MSMELRRLKDAVNRMQRDEWSKRYETTTLGKRLTRLEWLVGVGWVVALAVFAAWMVS